METLRVMIVAAVLVALSANPMLAAMLQCRCTDAKGFLCLSRAESESEASSHACCATKEASKAVSQPDSQQPPPSRVGCCCLQAPAAVPAVAGKFSGPKIEKHPFDDVVGRPNQVLAGLGVDRNLPTDNFFSTGPPLLALYCIWLK